MPVGIFGVVGKEARVGEFIHVPGSKGVGCLRDGDDERLDISSSLRRIPELAHHEPLLQLVVPGDAVAAAIVCGAGQLVHECLQPDGSSLLVEYLEIRAPTGAIDHLYDVVGPYCQCGICGGYIVCADAIEILADDRSTRHGGCRCTIHRCRGVDGGAIARRGISFLPGRVGTDMPAAVVGECHPLKVAGEDEALFVAGVDFEEGTARVGYPIAEITGHCRALAIADFRKGFLCRQIIAVQERYEEQGKDAHFFGVFR